MSIAIFDGDPTLVPVNNIFCIGANVTLARKTVDFGALFDLSSPPPPLFVACVFLPSRLLFFQHCGSTKLA